jgi:hypothetical protein
MEWFNIQDYAMPNQNTVIVLNEMGDMFVGYQDNGQFRTVGDDIIIKNPVYFSVPMPVKKGN